MASNDRSGCRMKLCEEDTSQRSEFATAFVLGFALAATVVVGVSGDGVGIVGGAVFLGLLICHFESG